MSKKCVKGWWKNKKNENVPMPSGLQRSKIVIWERWGEESEEEEEEVSIPWKPTTRKNKGKANRIESRKNMRKRALDITKCQDFEKEYFHNDPSIWIKRHVCSNKYHFKCSGHQYKKKDYWKINPENVVFKCRKRSFYRVLRMCYSTIVDFISFVLLT